MTFLWWVDPWFWLAYFPSSVGAFHFATRRQTTVIRDPNCCSYLIWKRFSEATRGYPKTMTNFDLPRTRLRPFRHHPAVQSALIGVISMLSVAKMGMAGWVEVPQTLKASNCCCTAVEPLSMEASGNTMVVRGASVI